MDTDAGIISDDLYEVVGDFKQWLRCHGGELSPAPAGERLPAARRAGHTGLLAVALAELPADDLDAIATAMPALTHLTGALNRSRPLPEDAR